MAIYALADLHLSLSIPGKTMEVFGSSWGDYISRVKDNWESTVTGADTVLIAGDISWSTYIDKDDEIAIISEAMRHNARHLERMVLMLFDSSDVGVFEEQQIRREDFVGHPDARKQDPAVYDVVELVGKGVVIAAMIAHIKVDPQKPRKSFFSAV